jgi:transglutaminase superfamily protein
MTAILEPDLETLTELGAPNPENRDSARPERPEDVEETPVEVVSLRPVLASTLSAAGAALVLGGTFGSWGARLFGLAMVLAGAGLTVWALRSKRSGLIQLSVPLLVAAVAGASVLPKNPTEVFHLMRDAVDAGRLLRPPVPFDPGWRPLLAIVLLPLAFSASWVGAGMKKAMAGVAIPVPIIILAAITQPQSEQVLTGLFALLAILGGFGVLYGSAGGARSADGVLQRDFELKRLLRGSVVMLGLAAVILGASQVDFLFPKPTVDPSDRPQKPKSIPLSASRNRVLFTVKAPAGFSGPWRTGVLDVYEDNAWKLAGGSDKRLEKLNGGVVDDTVRVDKPATFDVVITTRDLGPTAVLPTVPTASKVAFASGAPDVRIDPRAGVLRVPSGRTPSNLTYTLTLPSYPTADVLGQVPAISRDKSLLAAPPIPAAVQRIINQAPPGPWARLDYVRHKLLDNVAAVGAGSPSDITAKRVEDMLVGSKKATPFEIVAAQALLARWVGVPSRIGFGFNGVNDEDGVQTVRPRNAAQWLEVRIDGYGWQPLLDVPPQAQADLNDKNNDDRITPSSDIAVEVFVPIQSTNPRLLFEQVRAVLLSALPYAFALVLAWFGLPLACKLVRRRRRERWADGLGPRARIAVAYAEFRDAATDLAVGDPFATPLEFLARVQPDRQHTEFAWLVSRAMYGDLAAKVTDEDADAAELMGSSLARRLRQAQPLQVRAVAVISKSSLYRPFTDEVPGVRVPTPLLHTRQWLRSLRDRLPRVRATRSRRKVAA